MNNEPVALMRKTDITEFCEYNMEMVEDDNPNAFAKWIPLYTHQVKELTPCEELRAFQEQQNGVFSEHNACCYRHECRIVWNDWEKIRNNPVKELTDAEIHECWEMFMGTDDYTRIDIARAILRKAQE